MVFSSFIFIFYFLPLCAGTYFLAPKFLRNFVLLVWSLLFYAWGAPKIFVLYVVSCVLDFILARLLEGDRTDRKRKLILSASIILNIGALLYYKYFNFFLGDLNSLLVSFGFSKIEIAKIILPIGISFFTFHKISYVVDVYRRTVKPASNFINYALYISLFPQLVAGPIVRFHDICADLEEREHSIDKIFDGFCRFSMGLAKKILIADVLGAVADRVFSQPELHMSGLIAWLGIVCYAYQIYFDFSGYSDMAIGLAKVFGFTFLENFDRPYTAKNITEFWRRWHISLSRWMRDYLYIPLGGNRFGALRTYFNLWIVFFISGLWHGASWNFVFWGCFHGFFLCLDRLVWLKVSKFLPSFIQTLLTFIVVLIGWVFFRLDTFPKALSYLTMMFDPSRFFVAEKLIPRAQFIQDHGVFIFVLASLLCFLPSLEISRIRISESTLLTLKAFGCLALFVLSILSLASANYSPFIYFQF
jgi:alginate O-acetyltransferase complex protein AlgI